MRASAYNSEKSAYKIKDKKCTIFGRNFDADNTGNRRAIPIPFLQNIWCYSRIIGNQKTGEPITPDMQEKRLFVINYHSGIKPYMTILYKGEIYTVISIESYDYYNSELYQTALKNNKATPPLDKMRGDR